MIDREKLIDSAVVLGEKLALFGNDERSRKVIEAASSDNGWFTQHDILSSVAAIRAGMLDRESLTRWLSTYPIVTEPKSVGVIMAGNIPLVGFFDMLCVLMSGHKCYFKPSSKDRALTLYVVELIRQISSDLELEEYNGQPLDAVIATGSDNTNRYFRSLYGNIPSLFRGSRLSFAILSGSETDSQLRGLASDIFSYSGLGCRNVSHILLPSGYDVEKLAEILRGYSPVNTKYVNNYRQRYAILKMNGTDFIDGGFFLLRESPLFPEYISEITYQIYNEPSEVDDWLSVNAPAIQCVVHGGNLVSDRLGAIGFGLTQTPGLTDYADNKDVMSFLLSV